MKKVPAIIKPGKFVPTFGVNIGHFTGTANRFYARKWDSQIIF
ncbi:MAG TPA: hypothetical protein VMW55_09385 [Nitrosopumilaceae archaeon]|nr:hypothetical protein [Nitrosopumilaceae archaeon]